MAQKLKAPTKIGRPTGLPAPKTSLPGSKPQSALEKSARAAGINASIAEKYATDLLRQNFPGPDFQPSPTPDDEFKIGDRVFVGGSKPGVIAFIGETQFAPGEWAGVVLDNPVGKNDGSVAGHRYFQCEAKRGVFSRLNKLTFQKVDGGLKATASAAPSPEEPVLPPPAATPAKSTQPKTTNGAPNSAAPAKPTTTASVPKTSATPAKTSGLLKKGTISNSYTNLNKTSPSGSALNLSVLEPSGRFKVGERVVVSGTKHGVVQYIGATEFAKGEWVGVALDDPLGKNDGAVAGKRYFDCRPLHGLFAPLHKVQKLGAMPQPSLSMSVSAHSGLPSTLTTPATRRPSISKYGALSRERSGSQDSVSSISSNTSSASRSRLNSSRRLSQGTPKTSSFGTAHSLQVTNTALQKTLKEKEEHIEQLLRELDLERSEISIVAAQAEEAERELATFKSATASESRADHDVVYQLRSRLDAQEAEKQQLCNQLEEERRKVEDLQFTIEETAIDKGEIESVAEEDAARLKRLEIQVKEEQSRADAAEAKLHQLQAQKEEEKSVLKQAENSSDQYVGRIEELNHKLSQADHRIKALEAQRDEDIEKVQSASEDMSKSSQQIAELEQQLASKSREAKVVAESHQELEEELEKYKNKLGKQQTAVKDLEQRIAVSDQNSNGLGTQLDALQSQYTDVQRQLGSGEERCRQLEDDKSKLEHQISELMKNSGDSSEQLTLLNNQVIEKDRKLADLQAALSDSTQKLGKLQETISQKEKEREKEAATLSQKHEESVTSYTQQLEEALQDVEKWKSKHSKLQETFEAEQREVTALKAKEISDLKRQITKKDEDLRSKLHEIKIKDECIETLETEKDDFKFEKEKMEQASKKQEADLAAITGERDAAVKDREELKEQSAGMIQEKEAFTKQKEQLEGERDEAYSQRDKVAADKQALEANHNKLQQDKTTLAETHNLTLDLLDQHKTQVHDLKQQLEKEVSDKKTQLEQLQSATEECSQQKQVAADVQLQLKEAEGRLGEAEESRRLMEAERDALKMQVAKLKTTVSEKAQLETQQLALTKQIEELKKSESQIREEHSLEKSSLQSSLDRAERGVKERDSELQQAHGQLDSVMGELAALRSQAALASSLHQEKLTLQEKVEELEFSLAEAQASDHDHPGGGDLMDMVQKEKEAGEAQSTFLNSVIVDQQKKIEELKAQLYVVANGGDDVHNGSTNEFDIERRIPAPRLFCDICDQFDLHDTDDCPTQAMSDSPPPSSFHGNRNQERPYCDICEVFDHWTSQCDDEQTF